MSEEDFQLKHLIVRGLPCPLTKYFTVSRKNVEDAMDYIPGDGDVVIASYPKTGTHWISYILLQIRSKGEEFPSMDDVNLRVIPVLDATGLNAVLCQDPPRYYRHHFTYDKVQKSAKSKCIYIYRHPEDTLLSYYHFAKQLVSPKQIDFDMYFQLFLTGNVSYGSYFKHVLSFYEHRKDENLLMVSYEKLAANRKEEIFRIAKFLGEEHYKNLLEDEQTLSSIIERTSFDYMKKNLTMSIPGQFHKLPEKGKYQVVEFFRKGIVGDGKITLTETQRQLLREVAEKTLEGTSILSEWYSS